MSTAPSEPSLMYRSMKIQIDHNLKKRKRHHHRRKSKTSNYYARDSDTNLLVPPAPVIHQRKDPSPMNNYPELLSPDDDEGITFTASRFDGENEAGGSRKLSIQESSVPWKLNEMNVMTSESVSEEPHYEFGEKVFTSPSISTSAEIEVDAADKHSMPLHGIPEEGEVKIVIDDSDSAEEEGVNGESTMLGEECNEQQGTTAV